VRPSTNVNDLALRADLVSDHLRLLANAGELAAFSGNHRPALLVASARVPSKGYASQHKSAKTSSLGDCF
jgi:hypothetical protein